MMGLLLFPSPSNPCSSVVPNPNSRFVIYGTDQGHFRFSAIATRPSNRCSSNRLLSLQVACAVPSNHTETLKLPSALLQLVASAIFFVGFGARAFTASALPVPGNFPLEPAGTLELQADQSTTGGSISGSSCSESKPGNRFVENSDGIETIDDKDLQAAFENWKSKTYALTVPLRIIALRGSIPPSWVKDFVQAQGRRLKLRSEFRESLEAIFSELALVSEKCRVGPGSAMAADIVTIGDSWLNLTILRGLIEPIRGAEGQDWFNSLDEKWKVYLRRNNEGVLDSDGKIWAAPYRWGSVVIAYKKNKFKKHNIAPIEDWADLWRPELAGRVSMVDAPREVVGAVLKYMGASYNTKDINSQVNGGRDAVMRNLGTLQRQVRLFDSVHYLKAFGAGDTWVAVGWSSDVLPAAKRMSNVAVVVPKSGTSLWADLWAVPAATRFTSDRIGGRVRSPSPLIHQWMEFCLQAARALPFQEQVIPGASPMALALQPPTPFEGSQELTKGKPKLDTNLIAGKPPPEILNRCEFLEPLSEATVKDYQWLMDGLQKPGDNWINGMLKYIISLIRGFYSWSR